MSDSAASWIAESLTRQADSLPSEPQGKPYVPCHTQPQFSLHHFYLFLIKLWKFTFIMTNLFLHCQFCSLLLSEEFSFSICASYPLICASGVWLFATPWTATRQAPLSLGILQAGILEWVAMSSSRGSSQPRDWTHCRRILYQLSYQANPLVVLCFIISLSVLILMCFFLSVLWIWTGCCVKIVIYVLINTSKNFLLALMLNHFFVQCFCLSLQHDLPTLFLVFFFPVLLYGFLFFWVFCLFSYLFIYSYFWMK